MDGNIFVCLYASNFTKALIALGCFFLVFIGGERHYFLHCPGLFALNATEFVFLPIVCVSTHTHLITHKPLFFDIASP